MCGIGRLVRIRTRTTRCRGAILTEKLDLSIPTAREGAILEKNGFPHLIRQAEYIRSERVRQKITRLPIDHPGKSGDRTAERTEQPGITYDKYVLGKITTM